MLFLTWANAAPAHGKAHSATCASRKSALCPSFSPKGAFWPDRLTQSRILRFPDRTDCAFPSHRGAREVWGNPPPACGALWRMPQLGKRARATPRQPAGGLRQGPQASAWGLAARKGAVWAEGLADGAPWARPGHHQAASCGLRRCRELRISLASRETVPSAKRPPAKGHLRVRVRSRSHPGRGVLTSVQRLRVRSPPRPALPLAPERAVPHAHRRVAVYGASPSTFTTE